MFSAKDNRDGISGVVGLVINLPYHNYKKEASIGFLFVYSVWNDLFLVLTQKIDFFDDVE